MESFGEIFREIRISRGYSIEELADGIVSKSTISRFERLESDITFEKLLHLLEKIKVSMNEFVYLSSKKRENKSSLELLSKVLISNNIKMLDELVKKEWGKYEKTSDIYSKLTAIVLEAHYKSLIGEKIDYDDNLIFLTDYFFGCDLWTQFDIVLFADAMSFITIETAIVISKEIIKKTELFHNNRQSFETIINTLDNITLVCLENNRLKDANDFINILEKLDIDETFFLERVMLKFIKGVYLIKTGNITEGEKMAKDSLLSMNLADSFQFEMIFKQYLKGLQIKKCLNSKKT